MFDNKDLYPTPDDTIDLMINGENLSGKIILEPSAGTGNIINRLVADGADVLFCEIEPKLVAINESKAQFLKHDFLKVTSDEVSHIDFIFMNPPFSGDETHILHAWDIAPDGCKIVALCNSETLKNNYTVKRAQLTETIKDYGHYDHLGNVFSNSERSTEVEISLIVLHKPKSNTEDFSDYFIGDMSEDEESIFQQSGLTSYNAVRDAVQRYVGAIKLYDQVVENAVQMSYLTSALGGSDITFTCKEGEKERSKATFQKELQKKCWNYIFKQMDMEKFITKSLKDEINKFVERQSKVPFTMKNIYQIIKLISHTHEQRMDKSCEEIFDKITKHYDENRFFIEGWKTNNHYMVGRKFILPYMCLQDKWEKGSEKVSTNYGGYFDLIEDLKKALCWITATSINKSPNLDRFIRYRYQLYKDGMYHDCNNSYDGILATKMSLERDYTYNIEIIDNDCMYGQWYEWGFFRIKCFKKGTIHFEFLDEKIWMMFNQRVAKIKGYPLPEGI